MAGRKKCFCEQAVLDQAVQVFCLHGYHDTGIAQLVEELGVGRQSLYDTFGDKRSLFLKALDRYIAVQEEMRHRTLLNPATPARVRLSNLLEQLSQRAAEKDCRACLVIYTAMELAAEDEEVRVRVDRSLAGLVRDLHRLCEAAIPDGDETQLRPEVMAPLLMGQITALSVFKRAGLPTETVRQQIDALRALLATAACSTFD